MTARNAGRALGLLVLLLLAAVGCGVPTATDVRTVPDEEVPYGLLQPSQEVTAPLATSAPGPGSPTVYLVRGDELVGTTVTGPSGSAQAGLTRVLVALSQGPTEPQRAAGLRTAVPLSLAFDLRALDAGVATIELRSDDPSNVGDEGPLAVGQLVLSATSVPGVDSVVLTRDGRAVDAQLADGSLTDRPLTASDYAVLVDRAS
jgi:hypothetical protein